ncbi:hypothetical protein Tsubulata_000166 [Turnera subulata]|uniref:NPH3 domain-containing protein n=1 Tax=Turnera subulata TaxID=218843 RepID=A0A9Q0JP88_9ROSI|nr:hypothetical protein Tsubulata_000166 [Turnera subulata]
MSLSCVKAYAWNEEFISLSFCRICTTGLPSDITIEIGELSFNLHKFPLLSRSGLLEKLIEELPSEDGSLCVLKLDDVPGGAKPFEVIAKFCYGVKIELTTSNIVGLRCAAEYLRMTEDYGERNLIAQTEAFLDEVFSCWTDTIKALETCEEVMPYAEDIHIVSRCIDSLAMKACADPNVFNLTPSGQTNIAESQDSVVIWNGIPTETKPQRKGDDWWFEDVSFLNLPLYKRLILAVESRGMKPETIAAALVCYAERYLPLMNAQSSFNDINPVNPGTTSALSEADQRVLLEEIVALFPHKKGITSPKFLLRLLRAAMVLHASPSCRENLERRVGAQLDQAVLVDLLIPNMGYSVETLYDIDCAQRILDHFMSAHKDTALSVSPCIVEEGQFLGGGDTLTPITMVASLVDGYLAEVAPDVNLKLPKFEGLAATIPDYARPIDDGLYHAIDVYLKVIHYSKLLIACLKFSSHPWIMFCNSLGLDVQDKYFVILIILICNIISLVIEDTRLPIDESHRDVHVLKGSATRYLRFLVSLSCPAAFGTLKDVQAIEEDLDFKAHPWLIDTEREQLCRLMNCQKLSLEASTHAAQNERLPLRVIVQVLFFEQLRLRTSVSGWFYVSENLENPQNASGSLGLPKPDGSRQTDSAQGRSMVQDDMKERVSELEKECSSMKEELQKIVKAKKSWKIFSKRFGFRQRLQPCKSKQSCDLKEQTPTINEQKQHENGDMP